jgi:hypothetical protein
MSPTDPPGPVCAREEVGSDQRIQHTSRPGYQWTVWPRHGRRPLAVQARMLLRASNHCTRLPAWSEIFVHETRQGRLVAALQHHFPDTAFPDSAIMDWHDAWLHDDVPGLWSAILAHDPVIAVTLGGIASTTASGPFTQDEARCAEIARIAAFRAAWFGLVNAVFGLRA